MANCDSDTGSTDATTGSSSGGSGGCQGQPPPHPHVIVEVRAEDGMPLPDDTVIGFEITTMPDPCVFDLSAMADWKDLTNGNIACEATPTSGPPFTLVACELWTQAATIDVTATGYEPFHDCYPYELDTCGDPPATVTKKVVLNLEGTGGTGGDDCSTP